MRASPIEPGVVRCDRLFLFVVPGVIAAGLAERGELNQSSSNEALPALVQQVLPVGVRGLVVAGLLAHS